MQRATHVHIDDRAVATLCQAWVASPPGGQHASEAPLDVPGWNRDLHYFDGTPRSANYVLVLDALNFSFWPDPGQPRWTVFWREHELSGYWALTACLLRAIEDRIPVLDAGWLAEVTPDMVERLLRGTTGQIPLMEARHAHLQEVGRLLLERYDGQFIHVVEDVGRNAVRLALRVSDELSSFHDVARYHDLTVPLLKRAQITAVDLFGTFDGREWGKLTGLDGLTAFADYKVPQILRRLGILVYDATLTETVDRGVLIPPGDEREVEIRAATVDAVERIRLGLTGRGVTLKAFEIDWVLWGLTQRPASSLSHGLPALSEERPYHKTRTIFY